MKKFKLMRGVIFATSFSLLNPMMASAKEPDWTDDAKKWGKALVDWCQKVDDTVNDKAVDPIKDVLSDLNIYEHESLWLVTDKPNIDPNEERNYYFIDKNSPSFKWTFYYDEKGTKISSDDASRAKKEVREMYVSLTDPEVVFKIEEWQDYKTNTFTLNYLDLDKQTLYDPEGSYKYGRFIQIEDLIPEDQIKEKYSTKDLKSILEIINDPTYEIKKENSLGR